MRKISGRSIIAFAVAIVVSLILLIFVTNSPYIFALGLAIGAFLAQLTTFKSGIIYGLITAIPLSLYLVLSNAISGINNDLLSISLNILLLIVFGGIYTGVIVWIINTLKHGKIIFS